MNLLLSVLIPCGLITGVVAQSRITERQSLLQDDPEVVYLKTSASDAVKLHVVKPAPVFSDKDGKNRLGTLLENQTVTLEALAPRCYRVRGKGRTDGIVGWVAPWAFSTAEPEFQKRLKEFYERELQVKELIKQKQVVVGMTVDEVSESRGKPTKTSIRKTETGESGKWEWVDYEEVKHYITRTDPVTGQVYRQFSHVTQIEKGRTSVEFTDGLVTAVEETVDRQGGGNVRIVVPPITFGW